MFDLRPYIQLLWKRRIFLTVNFILVGSAATVMMFYVVKPEYSSQATFLPPVSASSGAMFAMGSNPLMGLLSGDDSGDNIETVFDSRAIKRRIIEKFNLYESYNLTKNPNKFENAVRRMSKDVVLSNMLKGRGIGMSKTVSYSVQTYHSSPDTALMMAEFVFACLDSAMIDISINKARRNREFIEAQFKASQERLDSLQEEFREFQVTHKAFDISEQMKMTLKVYADVKAAAVMNDMRLMTLQREFRGGSPEITAALNEKRILERTLAELEQKQDYSVMPSLNLSSELMPRYKNLYRALEVQNQVNLLLTRELEQARLQEARDVSPLVLIDPPYRAEYKARPKRASMVLAITMGYMFALALIILSYAMFTDFLRSGWLTAKPEK
jgi:capsule polysaccharide export protein KpsE/RkpR